MAASASLWLVMFRSRAAFLVLVAAVLFLTDVTTASWRYPVAFSLVGVILPYNQWLSYRTRRDARVPTFMAFGDQLLCLAYIALVPEVHGIAMVAATFGLALAALVFSRRVAMSAAGVSAVGAFVIGGIIPTPLDVELAPSFPAEAMAFAVATLTLAFVIGTMADRERRTSEELAGLIEGLGVVVWEYDIDTDRVTFVSQRVEAMLGHAPGAWHEPGFWQSTLHPDDREEAVRLRRGEAREYTHDYRIIGRDQVVRWVRDIVTREGQAPAARLRGIVSDVTAEKVAVAAADRAMRHDDALLRLSRQALIESEPEVMFDHAAATLAAVIDVPLVRVIRRGSDGSMSVVAYHGLTPAEGESTEADVLPMLATHVLEGERELLVAADLAEHPEWVPDSTLRRHGVRACVIAVIPGRARPYGAVTAFDHEPRKFHPDEVAFVRAVAAVLAEALARSAAEERVVRAERMEAVGRLAGAVAHDFNNMLMAIYGYTEELQPLVGGGPAATVLEDLHQSATAAAGLARELLTLSSGHMGEAVRIDVAALVAALRPGLELVKPGETKLILELEPNAGYANLGVDELREALTRLVENAMAASPPGGEVRVRVRRAELDVAAAERVAVAPGVYVVIEVSDQGEGLSEELAARAFEPRVRVGPPGAGLGLAPVYGTVRKARGGIEVETQTGEGSSYVVYLPADVPTVP